MTDDRSGLEWTRPYTGVDHIAWKVAGGDISTMCTMDWNVILTGINHM